VRTEAIAGRIALVMRFEEDFWRNDSDVEQTIDDLKVILSAADLAKKASLTISPAGNDRGAKFFRLLQPLLPKLQEKGHEIRMIDLETWRGIH